MDHAEIFDRIYATNFWKQGSGPGSTEEATRQYRVYLQNFLKTNNIRSVLDVGCGDWQFSQYIDWSGIEYVGVDVSAVVLSNTRKFTRPGIAFRELNAVKDPLPQADLLIAKDVLQHWSNADILAFIPKLTSFRNALITNGFNSAGMSNLNQDIVAGSWRPVDLRERPYHLPGSYVFWFDAGEPKSIYLWSNPNNQAMPAASP